MVLMLGILIGMTIVIMFIIYIAINVTRDFFIREIM